MTSHESTQTQAAQMVFFVPSGLRRDELEGISELANSTEVVEVRRDEDEYDGRG